MTADADHSRDHTPKPNHHQSFWLWVMCLTGVDYFSTLGYQPAIAFQNAGMLAPLATILLVMVTLFGALPIYMYVAGQSPNGLGSIGMLERLVHGWPGKFIVLTMLGFAATDFVITKTLSAADATSHLIENPLWPFESYKYAQRMGITILLLLLLGAMFLRGFREVIGLAVLLAMSYLLLNLIIVVLGMYHLYEHPEKVLVWWERVTTNQWYIADPPIKGSSTLTLVLLCLLIFPKLALGLSGFETGVAVMPLIKGKPTDTETNPAGRIRNARKLMITAALIMSFFLLSSSVLVSTLIPPTAFVSIEQLEEKQKKGLPLSTVEQEYLNELKASNRGDRPLPTARDRALAYIAHNDGPESLSPLFGPVFGTIYDLSTIAILWFAGASAMAGLLNLVPQYLPRYGMAPEWARAVRPLVLLFTAINLLVTWIFRADVESQGGAYATGVLMLMTSACLASVIDVYRKRQGKLWQRLPWGFTLILLVFVYTTTANIIEKPDGIKIASFFICTIITTSIISRLSRSRELRFDGFELPDPQSKFLWESILSLEMPILVPHRPGRRSLISKEAAIRKDHRLPPELPILFVEVGLADASEFVQKPTLTIEQEEGRYILKISNAASIAHAIAAVALELAKHGQPPEIHCGWTDETPLAGTLGFLLFGEGNVPWMVHDLIRRAEPDPSRRPPVIIAGR